MPYIKNTDSTMQTLVALQERILDPASSIDDVRELAILVLTLAEKDLTLITSLRHQVTNYEGLVANQDKVIETQHQLIGL